MEFLPHLQVLMSSGFYPNSAQKAFIKCSLGGKINQHMLYARLLIMMALQTVKSKFLVVEPMA